MIGITYILGFINRVYSDVQRGGLETILSALIVSLQNKEVYRTLRRYYYGVVAFLSGVEEDNRVVRYLMRKKKMLYYKERAIGPVW